MATPKFVTFETSSKALNKLLTPKGLKKEGLRSGQVMLTFGRHKRAKSTLMLDIAFNALEKGATVAYVDADINGIDFYRLNLLLTAREGRPNTPPPLPEEVLNFAPADLEKAFKKHLAQYKFFLYVAKNATQLEQFYMILSNKPHVLIIDSITLFFRQATILKTRGSYGSAVDIVEGVATMAREYAKGASDQFPAPNGSALVLFTAQTKSSVSAYAKEKVLEQKQQRGQQIHLRDKEEERPFIGGEGLGFLDETFIELINDENDKGQKTRVAIITGSRNLEDGATARFKTCDAGICDV